MMNIVVHIILYELKTDAIELAKLYELRNQYDCLVIEISNKICTKSSQNVANTVNYLLHTS